MRAFFLASFIFLAVADVSALDVSTAEAAPPAPAAALTPRQIADKAVDADPWGRGGVEATARVTVTEPSGQKRELAFEATSRRYAATLSKSLLHFTAPADVSGMKFLLVQKADGDDERTLYVPELKRSRRIVAGTRSEKFMGTDFTYADMDRHDVRSGEASLLADENIGRYPCYHVAVTPKSTEAGAGRVEIWVRKDILIPLKWVMFDSAGAPAKTLLSKELQRHDGRWQITRSAMTDRASGRTTEILIERMTPREVPLEEFSIQNLERQ